MNDNKWILPVSVLGAYGLAAVGVMFPEAPDTFVRTLASGLMGLAGYSIWVSHEGAARWGRLGLLLVGFAVAAALGGVGGLIAR